MPQWKQRSLWPKSGSVIHIASALQPTDKDKDKDIDRQNYCYWLRSLLFLLQVLRSWWCHLRESNNKAMIETRTNKKHLPQSRKQNHSNQLVATTCSISLLGAVSRRVKTQPMCQSHAHCSVSNTQSDKLQSTTVGKSISWEGGGLIDIAPESNRSVSMVAGAWAIMHRVRQIIINVQAWMQSDRVR